MRSELGSAQMPHSASIVFVVDDDVSVRESLELLVRNAGWQPETFESAQQFLARTRPQVPSCLVLDLSLPGVGGLDLQKQVSIERPDIPIIFITGHGDLPKSVQAMKAAAVEFLTKPVSQEVLLGAIRQALEQSCTAISRESEMQELRKRYALLSLREREVMALVVSGRLNKQIGGELDISVITVKTHLGKVMHKMRADSLADLVHMAAKLRLKSSPPND